MLTLKEWRAICKKALKKGFTKDDHNKSMNPCLCAIGECASIMKTHYGCVFIRVRNKLSFKKYLELNAAECDFMCAIDENKPKKALVAIRKIESIVNKLK